MSLLRLLTRRSPVTRRGLFLAAWLAWRMADYPELRESVFSAMQRLPLLAWEQARKSGNEG